MKLKIAVIGSNSFSGSDFIDLLIETGNFSIIGLSRSAEKSKIFLPYKRHTQQQFKFYQLNLNTDINKIINLLNTFKPEYIVNFAAQSEVAPSWKNPAHWFETNVVSLTKLVHYLNGEKYLKRFMQISSPEVYGTCQGRITENAPLNPSTPYAASKAAADLLLATYVKNFNFPLITIRSTNVYGPHQQLFKIIPRSIISLKLGRKISLHGGGTAVKSYIHIRDISRGELQALDKGKTGELYHFSPPAGISVRNVVALICEKMNQRFENSVVVAKERLGQDKAYVIDSTKARKLLKWSPQIALEDGIAETISWIEKNWPAIKKLPHEYLHKQ